VTSLRQLEANRRNSGLSTGPKTSEGKERARRNALKHGLSGEGIVLPEEEEQIVEERLDDWSETLQPASGYEEWLTEQIVVESVRIDTGRHHDNALRGLQVHRAHVCWNDDRRLAAETLAGRLAKAPGPISQQLRQTAQGCDRLIERWEQLARIIEAHGCWTEPQQQLALDMLGTPTELRDGPTPLDPTGETSARDVCLALCRSEIEALRQRQSATSSELEEHEQAAAALGLPVEEGRPLTRVRRYTAACVRRLHWAVRQLEKVRGGDLAEFDSYLPEMASPPPFQERNDPQRRPCPARDRAIARTNALKGQAQRDIAALIDSRRAARTNAEIDPAAILASQATEEPAATAPETDKPVDNPSNPAVDSMADWVQGQRPRRDDTKRRPLKKQGH
jgi:hypothetical protein